MIKDLDLTDDYLWYNPVNEKYLTIEYLTEPPPTIKEFSEVEQKHLWGFAWVDKPVITTWISFKGKEADKLTTFISQNPDGKHGMFVPFKFVRIREGVNIISVDHILSVSFAVANLDDIGGLHL